MSKGPGAKSHPPLVVRYYKRMKKQKVYTAQVSWQSAPNKGKGTEPYTVRLVMAGTQVVPGERIMDPTKPKDKAVFYITPIARKGQLRGERLEVLQGGQKVQELALPAKVSSIKWFWIFLILAFLVPWFMITYLQTDSGPKESYAGRWSNYINSTDDFLSNQTPIGKENHILADNLSEEASDGMKNLYTFFHYALTQDQLVLGESSDMRLYLPCWLAVGFFVLALLAWCLGREKRRKRTSKPLPISGE